MVQQHAVDHVLMVNMTVDQELAFNVQHTVQHVQQIQQTANPAVL